MSGRPRVTETYLGTVAGAVVGLVQWALVQYAFGGHEPAPVASAVYVLIPMGLGAGFAFFTRRESKLPGPPE